MVEATRARVPAATVAIVAMLVVTAIWGSTFVVVKDAVARMPVMDFLAWRFVAAAVVLLLFRPRSLRGLSRGGLAHGTVLGLLIGAGFITQTFGLALGTPASVSGFITGMYIVFTPLIAGVLLRRRIGPAAWFAVALATAGLALTSLRGLSFGVAEVITLGCAAAFAFHIVGLAAWSSRYDAYALAVVQIGTVGVLCLVVSAARNLATGHMRVLALPPDGAVWGALAITALLATAFGFLAQTWAQRHVPPTRIAVVMTMEPVFAGIFGVLYGEHLDWATIVGGALVLAAMYVVQLRPEPNPADDVERLEM